MINNLNIERGVPTEDGAYVMWGPNGYTFIGIVEDGDGTWIYPIEGPFCFVGNPEEDHFYIRLPNETSGLEAELVSQN